MENKSCLKCKYSAYALVNLKEMEKSLFYCEKLEDVFNNTTTCKFYQKRSSKKE